MSAALTCWKDIANYLGKGVRTVQRWEREAGLPVKRPSSRKKGIVFALPDELDAWLETTTVFDDDSTAELNRLRTEVERLLAENQILRHQLQAHLPHRSAIAFSRETLSTEEIWYRCASALIINKSARQEHQQLTGNYTLRREQLAGRFLNPSKIPGY